MLAADAMTVPVDLVLSTTMRALKAIEAVFLGLIARYGPPSGLNSSGADLTSSGLSSGTPAPSASKCDPTSVLDALTTSVCSLVSTVLSALFAQHTKKAKEATKKKIGIAQVRAAHTATAASAAAIDAVLGGLYAHILGPALRAFATLSEGYLTTCLAGNSNNTIGDELTILPDLRPDAFVLLGDVLTVLEDTFSGNEPTSSAAPSVTVPATPAASAAIPALSDVRTILALECVRELGKLYLPPDPPRLRSLTDESARPNAVARAPHGYAQDDPPSSDSPWQAYSRPGTTPTACSLRARLANASDCASTSGAVPSAASCSSSASRAGTGTLPGSALSSVGVGAGVSVSASVGRGAPRAPRNLGETYSGTSSGPGRGPVSADHPSTLASLPGSKEVEAAAEQERVRPLRAPVRYSGRAGAVADIVSVVPSADGNPQAKRKRQRRETGEGAADLGARIAKLAKKDTVWWLCAVLDRLLPSLPAPPSASTSASPHASQLEAMSLGSASGNCSAPAMCNPSACTSMPAAPTARCVDVAYEAVYDALADLLRRTRPRLRLEHIPPAAAAVGLRPSPPSLRGLSSSASNHARAGSSRTSRHRGILGSAEEGLAEMEVEGEAGAVAVDMAVGEGSSGNSNLWQASAKDARKAEAHGGRMGPREVLGETVDQRAGQGGVEMGEVERGLLLAVLERAWLGV
ncbi:hypothetical protein C8Q73DRAFT_667206 [Cubamyces lactineus]|nr:hypothetical protein C8Q73DRAFT_667206 [Cubamyces lactineus]